MQSESFERIGARRGVWDVSRDCEKPVPVVLHSRATGDMKRVSRKGVRGVPGIELTLLTPCRRCPVCLRKKSRLWAYRAKNEILRAPRSWFGTLTARPDMHFRFSELAATRKRDFWVSDPVKKFEQVSVVFGAEVTKYLKRLRKAGRTQFRYLCVVEIHDSDETSPEFRGLPHVHLLMHEIEGLPPLKKAILDGQWHHGFTRWRVCDEDAAGYVTKYISKALDARVRASEHYGNI